MCGSLETPVSPPTAPPDTSTATVVSKEEGEETTTSGAAAAAQTRTITISPVVQQIEGLCMCASVRTSPLNGLTLFSLSIWS